MDAIVLIVIALVLVLKPAPRAVVSADDGAAELATDNTERRTCINETLYKDENAFMAIAKSIIKE